VRRYLLDVWSVDSARVEITSRALPEHPSGERTEAGKEENRRVEIESDDPAILEPLESVTKEQLLHPPMVHFFPGIVAEGGLERWHISVTDGETELRSSDGYSTYPDTIPWNWRTTNGSLSLTGDTLFFTLSARDKLGNQASTPPRAIPVTVVNKLTGEREQKGGRMFEKISLILFDFDRAQPGSRNRRLLEFAGSRLQPASVVVVRGYTDELGEADYNLKLSQERASAVRSMLLDINPAIHASTEGYGETDPLFANDTPEGRFYCRTVQIVVETVGEK
jgi:outer membrane protein OmpA-like peptidoglycan-associated protein